MPKLDQLQADMDNNEAFRAYGSKAPDSANPGEQLQKYHEWLSSQRAWIEGEKDLNPDELRAHRSITLFNLSQSQAFLDALRKRNTEYFDGTVRGVLGLSILSWMQLPATESVPLIGHYRHWLDDSLDDATVALSEMGVKARLKRNEREELTGGFEKFKGENLHNAQEAGENYQKAKAGENAAKRQLLALLGESKKDVAKISAQDCIKQAQKRIGKLTQDIVAYIDKITKLSQEIPDELERTLLLSQYEHHVFKQQELWQKLEAAQEELQKASGKTTETEDQSKKEEQAAQLVFGSLNQDFRLLNQQVVDASLDLRTDVNQLEAGIARKKLELEGLIALIPDLHDQLASESETLQKLQAYPKSEMRAEYARSVQELKERIEATQYYHEDVARELAFLDAQYAAVRDAADEELEEHERLLAMRDAARDELAWIKKLRKVDKAMNIYCSAFGVSFPMLLQIGNLVGGTGGGAVGGTTTALVSGLQGFFAVGGGYGAFAGVLEAGAVGKILSQCKPYDTGGFSLSLKLGLSYGLPGEWGGRIGLALIYDAGINIQDDRRFRATSTLTVQAAAEASLPELFEASIKADLIKDATTFEYKDHYQWAAWLAQKWANIFAWARACSLYERKGNRLDQPTHDDLERIRSLAKIILAENPKTHEILLRAAKFMEEPILRVEQREKLSGISADVSFVDTFGAGFEGERPGEPQYIKRELDHHTQRLIETRKEGRNWAFGGSLQVVAKVSLTLSRTERHSNPDNNGYALNLKLSYPGTSQSTTWLNTPKQETAATQFGDWIETTLVPVADKLSYLAPSFQNFTGPLKTTQFTTLTTQLSLADFEMNFVRSDLPDGKTAWVLQYWRPIFSSTTELTRSIPLHAGINLDVGGSLGLSRTYKEQLGTNTLTYVRLVYHGFMNRTPPGFEGDEEKTRPKEAWGKTLWDDFAKAHQKQLYKLCRNVGKDDSWVRKETVLLTGHEAFIEDCKGLAEKFDDTAFNKAKKALDTFLESARTTDYHKDCEEGWKALEAGEFMWSINPYQMALEVKRTRSAAYKLDKATQGLKAPRRGLREQIAEDRKPIPDGKKNTAYWIPDAQAPKCMACGARFSLITRRHHCRNCGGVFCGKCASKRRAVPERGYREMVRVCDACDTLLGGGKMPISRTLDPSTLKLATGLRKDKSPHSLVHQAKPSGQHPSPLLQQKPKQDPLDDGEFVMIIEESEPSKFSDTKPHKQEFLGHGGKSPEQGGLLIKGSSEPSKVSGYKLTPAHKERLVQYNREEESIPANGDCLFAALIAMGISDKPPATQPNIQDFRNKLSSAIRNGTVKTSDLPLTQSTTVIADNIKKMGHFGDDDAGQYAPLLIARFKKVVLHILKPDGGVSVILPEGKNPVIEVGPDQALSVIPEKIFEMPGCCLIHFESRDVPNVGIEHVPHYHATKRK